MFSAMFEQKVLPDTISFSATISACEKAGQWQRALHLFSFMPLAAVLPDAISFSAAISAVEKVGEWQMALCLFEAMNEASVRPDVISFSATISACSRGGQWQQALGLLQSMPQTKVQPNIVSFSACISAFEKAGKWQQALSLFGDMPTSKIQPNRISFASTISACEKAGQWQQALVVFQAMPTKGVHPDVVCFNTSISACKRDRQWQQALAMFDAMPGAAVVPDEISYACLIDCLHGYNYSASLAAFSQALRADCFEKLRGMSPDIIDLHDLSEAASQLAVQWWLSTIVAPELGRRQRTHDTFKPLVVTGYGKSRQVWDTSDVQESIIQMLRGLSISVRVLEHNIGRLQLDLGPRDLPVLKSCVEERCATVGGSSSEMAGFGAYPHGFCLIWVCLSSAHVTSLISPQTQDDLSKD